MVYHPVNQISYGIDGPLMLYLLKMVIFHGKLLVYQRVCNYASIYIIYGYLWHPFTKSEAVQEAASSTADLTFAKLTFLS